MNYWPCLFIAWLTHNILGHAPPLLTPPSTSPLENVNKLFCSQDTVCVVYCLRCRNGKCIHDLLWAIHSIVFPNLHVDEECVQVINRACLQQSNRNLMDDSCFPGFLLVYTCILGERIEQPAEAHTAFLRGLVASAGWLAEYWSGSCQTCRTCSYGPV